MSTKAYIDTATAAIVQPMLDKRDARIKELEAELFDLKCDMIKRERYHKAELVALREALEYLRGEYTKSGGGPR
jgi:hypothetical protein